MRHVNIIGKKFGKLTVLEEISVPKRDRKRYYEKCLCDCGNTTLVEKSKIVCGYTRSCGCIQTNMRKHLGSKLMKKKEGEAAFNLTYASYIKSAKARGYPFELTEEEFAEIVVQPCVYCGDVLTQEKYRKTMNGSFKYTGIDRYDNTKGYVIGNCVPCCSRCNRIKTNMDANELKDRLTKIMARVDIWSQLGKENYDYKKQI